MNLSTKEVAKPVFFPNLNGLRFLAASMVIVSHIEQHLDWFNIKSSSLVAVHEIGKKGVSLFFVLSGFLITYLLLQEKATTQTISLKNFYLKRIYRIWPLYYLVVISAFFILPHFHFFNLPGVSENLSNDFNIRFVLFLFILPNVSQILYPFLPFGSQLWSIGVEEQFYIIWPLIIKISKKVLTSILVFIAGLPLIIIFITQIIKIFFHTAGITNTILLFAKNYLTITSIDLMAMGALASLLLIKKHKWLTFIYHPITQYFVLAILILFFGTNAYLPMFNNIMYGIPIAIFILNLASNPAVIINLKNPVLDYLGKISYGIYMYHLLGIFISLKCLIYMGLKLDQFAGKSLLYICSFSLTIAIAAVSFRIIETPILKLKHRLH